MDYDEIFVPLNFFCLIRRHRPRSPNELSDHFQRDEKPQVTLHGGNACQSCQATRDDLQRFPLPPPITPPPCSSVAAPHALANLAVLCQLLHGLGHAFFWTPIFPRVSPGKHDADPHGKIRLQSRTYEA